MSIKKKPEGLHQAVNEILIYSDKRSFRTSAGVRRGAARSRSSCVVVCRGRCFVLLPVAVYGWGCYDITDWGVRVKITRPHGVMREVLELPQYYVRFLVPGRV